MNFYSDEMNENILLELVNQHRELIERYDILDNYYRGKHKILDRVSNGDLTPNNRLVCNFAKYITDTSVGYAFGNPIIYRFQYNTDIMKKLMYDADCQTHDSELAKDLSVFGNSFELIYINENKIKLALLDPRNAFIVRDNTVLEQPVFGVIYGKEGGKKNFVYRVYDKSSITTYTSETEKDIPVKQNTEEHLFGKIPIIEYINNEERMGDFEHVLSLIDAYNVLQSDRLNDKEKFVNSLLLIKGCQILDENSASKIMTNNILELPFENADAKYLTKSLSESDIEILRLSIAGDIHKFSQTPDFSDKHFSGNTSGVAIKYKLLSIENLAKVKERFFIAGLKERVRLFQIILKLIGQIHEVDDLAEIKFNRVLPINEYELAKTIEALHGIVPDDELLARWN